MTTFIAGGDNASKMGRDLVATMGHSFLLLWVIASLALLVLVPSWRRKDELDEIERLPLLSQPLSKRTWVAVAIALVAIPFTIFIGINYFNDRRYFAIALLLIIECMLPFAFIFEGRKPQAREVIIIAVLCAIAVAGRVAFGFVPQFKPVVAIVIIAAVAFGGETGFLVGAVSAFVSNMFFGQGPWTPWQMFAMGLIGLIAGILFRKGLLARSPMSLAVFGGIVTLLIYGMTMDTASLLIWQMDPTLDMLPLYLIQGIPFNLIHAAASVIFLLLISRPMLEKLDRIKLKYGLVS
jgi:energy-coupling factor transport system ATP-binding protein